jgi:hypothetical protein
MSDVRYGLFAPLEQAADELIFGSLQNVTSQAAKKDILTPWKEMDRKRKEVMATSGTVDPAVRRGMYHRVANLAKPYLNSRDGYYPASRRLDGTSHSTAHGSDDDTYDDD